MIKTRLTELVGLKYPIIQAGMGPYPVTSLCIAAANAGVVSDVVGTAPQAQILAMKVFSSSGSNGACAAHLPPRPARPTPSSLKTSASRHTPRPPMTM
mgnify:CR=1 FL=1